MSANITSPRIGFGIEGMDRYLRDLEIRLSMKEQDYIGPRRAVGVTAVATAADLPEDPTPGDLALASDTDVVYTAQANGSWQVGGSIP